MWISEPDRTSNKNSPCRSQGLFRLMVSLLFFFSRLNLLLLLDRLLLFGGLLRLGDHPQPIFGDFQPKGF